ncbi:1-deoxy-D-xylulose-5-phosphate synthase [Candidatus Pantoea edessiphila]|uniref:1-deoxy-D-xylulose-5-phosphate synthase n=1 Tax=Candidatus Pantoea edessiphila TaxID=2044610 RepID=A0A2P5T1B8_9GAMM|nr:1-deoxy-D-xylulose-5-phosphate synthase [Candidatus Pantoea edessiphila]PPI88394.1 1-deoxy-D-xylulose-5-phosphate synthase [Candidatus Pantoea edessiphila]
MVFNPIKYPILSLVKTVKKLRCLSTEMLFGLCDELRHYLLNNVSYSSGHLSSGLGVIELTVALHYVYNTPFDYLIWDVGHQAYPHKILTGRRELISTIRKRYGLHPFPCRSESEFDVLTVGHSSTSIGVGVGLAITEKYENEGRHVVCVIGDGAITAGMAFEAMNHAGDIKPNMLIILNDNKMSISKNVGALHNRLTKVLSGDNNSKLRENSEKALTGIPQIKEIFKHTEECFKNIDVPSGIIFEELGLNYIGPIDGHDLLALIHTFKNMRKLKGPQLLHIITKKGKGYAPAEKDPTTWHSVPKFDLISGVFENNLDKFPSYSKIFGNWLCEMAEKDSKLIAITPAMKEGSGMVDFSRKYPNQYFDVAIAEQHAVTFASGIAIGGYKPIVAIYSTFLQRAYDQVIHDVAIQRLPVLFAIDRGGIVGTDGQTHQGAFDLAYLRCIPNMVIMTPSDENECRQMLYTGYKYTEGPSAVRYPRGNGIGIPLTSLKKIPLGTGIIRRAGKKIAILNFGTLLIEAINVGETLNTTVVDMRFVKPLDETLISKLATNHEVLITLEEGSIKGGAGSGVNEFVMIKKLKILVLNIGLPDKFIPQGNQDEIRDEFKLNSNGIIQQIVEWLAK